MKRTVATLVFSLAATLGMSGLAFADGSGDGDYCGASSNGCAHSGATAGSCAGHGSFGAFGKGYDWRGGADGDNTAFANSRLCGNPQGAAGVDE